MNGIKRILVVSTSTSTCKRTIHNGVTLAKKLGAKLYVYHSDFDPFNLEGWGLPIPSLQVVRKDYRQQMEEDRTMLNRVIEEEKTPLIILFFAHPICSMNNTETRSINQWPRISGVSRRTRR